MTTGGCLCSAVRFEVGEFCSDIFKCHCSRCRKAFGGASSAAALAPRNALQWLQGEQRVKEFRLDSGFTRRFCPACGSLLPQFLPDYNLYWIPVGLLDSDPGIALKHHIHVKSKAPWEVLDSQTRQLDGGFDS